MAKVIVANQGRDRAFLAMLKHRRKAHRTLFKYLPGMSLAAIGGSNTRGSTANYFDAAGVMQSAANNVARDNHWINGVRTLLLEGQRTNQCLQSNDLTSASWGKGAASALKNATGVDRVANSASTLTEDGTNAGHFCSQGSLAITANTTQSFTVALRANGRTNCRMYLINTADFFGVTVNLAAGTAVALSGGAGTVALTSITAYCDGWYLITFTGKVNAASTTATFQMDMAAVAGNYTYQGDGVSGMKFMLAMHEKDALFPSSPIATGAGSVTRSSDTLTFTYLPVPSACTLYGAAVYRMATDASQNYQYLAIGDGTPAVTANAAGMRQDSGAVSVRGLYKNATTLKISDANPAVVFGNTLEMRETITDAGVMQCAGSVNAAAETVGTAQAANALPALWAAQEVFVGPAAGGTSFIAFKKIVILPGVQPIGLCRAA